MWSKLTTTVFDTALNLIVALIGTSGLLWLTGSAQSYDPAMPVEKIRCQIDDQQKQNDDLRNQCKKVKNTADAMEQDVTKATSQCPDPDIAKVDCDHAQEVLDGAQKEARRLDEELRRLLLLKDELVQERRQSEEARKKAEDIKKQLIQKGGQINQQREKIAEIKREEIQRPIVPINIVPHYATDSRQAVFVLLSRGTVTPVRAPYYSFAQSGNAVHAELVKRGDAVHHALSAGSDFQKLLDEINPSKQYVFFLVDSSSFETFRAVREELRGRDIPMGWEPYEQTGLGFGPGGRDTGISN